jgi:hypothetical protein
VNLSRKNGLTISSPCPYPNQNLIDKMGTVM